MSDYVTNKVVRNNNIFPIIIIYPIIPDNNNYLQWGTIIYYIDNEHEKHVSTYENRIYVKKSM